MNEAILFTVAALLMMFAMSVVQTRIFRSELHSLEQSRHYLGTICDYWCAKHRLAKEQHKVVLDLYAEEKKRSAALLGTVRSLRRQIRNEVQRQSRWYKQPFADATLAPASAFSFVGPPIEPCTCNGPKCYMCIQRRRGFNG